MNRKREAMRVVVGSPCQCLSPSPGWMLEYGTTMLLHSTAS